MGFRLACFKGKRLYMVLYNTIGLMNIPLGLILRLGL